MTYMEPAACHPFEFRMRKKDVVQVPNEKMIMQEPSHGTRNLPLPCSLLKSHLNAFSDVLMEGNPAHALGVMVMMMMMKPKLLL